MKIENIRFERARVEPPDELPVPAGFATHVACTIDGAPVTASPFENPVALDADVVYLRLRDGEPADDLMDWVEPRGPSGPLVYGLHSPELAAKVRAVGDGVRAD